MRLTQLQMIVIVVAGLGTAGLYYLLFQQPAVAPQACTDEAMLCPDGSAVGRTGPNCTFAACPGVNTNTTTNQDRADAGCYIGGCSGQVCSNQPDVVTTCELRDEYVCYQTARCVKKANERCGWESTPALSACLDQYSEPITESSALSVTAVTSDPLRYDGRRVCLTGWYQSSHEFNAMGGDVRTESDGNRVLAEPYVELYSGPNETLECRPSGNTEICIGQVTECGVFDYAVEGEAGFGVSGNIRYQLQNS